MKKKERIIKYNGMVFKKFRKVYYAYNKGEGGPDSWVFSDGTDVSISSLAYYNADLYRIDECYKMFIKELTK